MIMPYTPVYSPLKQGGLTFLEMGYMPMQAFDFVHLNDEFGCILQIGGSDQWSNHDALLADKDEKYHELWNAQAQYYQ